MNQEEIKLLFAIVRSAIDGKTLSPEEQMEYKSDMLPTLLETSFEYDIIHLLVMGLKQNGLIPKENSELDEHMFKAVYRYELLHYEYETLCRALEKEEIPFLPLKGSVIRQYYPEPWMRTSCDIDVLVHEEDAEKAKSILIEKYGYTYEKKGAHDLSFYTTTGMHIELHYDLVEDGRIKGSSKILQGIWNHVIVHPGFCYWYEMPEDMFYFYHIAHMAKHFEDGGCGIRPFIDLWILEHIKEANAEKRNEILKQGELLRFAEVSRKLSRVWFENEPYDPLAKQMEDYLLRGGIYGSNENRVMVHQQKKGGRIQYALSKIWIPYDLIKFHYPVLEKQRWLLPFMQVRRWAKLIFCGHLKRTAKELQYNSHISDTEASSMQKFLDDVGL